MKNKTLAVTTMVSMLALTACGGGGGSGGVTITPPKAINLGTVDFSSLANGNFVTSAIVQVTQDGKMTATEAVGVFKWINENPNIDTSEFGNYEVTVDGQKMSLQSAWDKLLGYKKVYYDGKEDFWQGIVDSGKFDDENAKYLDVKAFAQNEDKIDFEKVGKGEKTVDDIKKDITPIVDDEEEEKKETPPVDEEEKKETPPPADDDKKEETPPPADEVTETNREQIAKEMIKQTVTGKEATNTSKSIHGETTCTDTTLADGTTYTGKCMKWRVQTNYTETLVKTWNVTYKVTYSDNSVKAITVQEESTHSVPTSPVVTYEYTKLDDNNDDNNNDNGNDDSNDDSSDNKDDTNDNTTYVKVDYTHSDLGTPTDGAIKDASEYRTEEFYALANHEADNLLQAIKADAAWSRGWTGKGSIVIIADTGTNVNHTDLDGNIIATKNFMDGSTDVSDSVGHGTHVAGITGAEINNTGMIGVAPDVKMMIAKVTDNTAYSFSRAMKAAEWGKENGSIAINVSAEIRLDNGFKASLVKGNDGSWYSTHWYYGINGYNGSKGEATNWKKALGNEQVLVKAAGNQGTEYSSGMNQMATATDSNGNLILDGQMLVVGSYDIANKKISGFSNKAGTICTTYTDGECKDAAKISDYYILAPGTGIYSTSKNGNYVHMSGTSMAAPAVTGALAVVHQMWPHMKGKNLVKLLTQTADKTIASYSVDIHGQGLLDLDKATQPVGATGIPTSGRTNGNVSSTSGYIAGSSGNISQLANVMVLDSFERDFYVDMSNTYTVDTRANKFTNTLAPTNMYYGYANLEQHLMLPSYPVSETFSVQPGFFTEDKSYLANTQTGAFGDLQNSYTTYANLNYSATYDNVNVFGQFGLGYTKNSYGDSWSMLKDASGVVSSTWLLGAEKNGFGGSVSQPINIESAKMTYSVPTSRTLDGNVISTDSTINLKTEERNLDFTAYYKYNKDNVGFKVFVEQRTGGIEEVNGGAEVVWKF